MEISMIAIINNLEGSPELEFEIERLRRLADDLDGIQHGRHPGRKVLSTAPRIEGWHLAVRPTACLTGCVFGHPWIKEGGIGITTDLWAIAPALGYARTLSRFYVLGERKDAPPHELH
jgi:hypothetical protein